MSNLEKLNLEGKVAIVTGGGTGLGKVMCLALAKAGADVAVVARRVQLIEETASEIRKLGRRAIAVPTDVTKSGQVNSMAERVIAELGKVDILVNNAGFSRTEKAIGGSMSLIRKQLPPDLWGISDADWQDAIDSNLTSVFYCCRAVGKQMLEKGWGRIINVSSGFGIRGGRAHFTYSPSKAGVILFTKCLATAWARNGIRANCIAPGFLPTIHFEPEALAVRSSFIPVGRVGQPWEVGPLAVYLASDAADYVNGQVFSIDGGALAGGYAPTGYAPVIPI